ncbi:hypothetical protein Salat_2422600 [Sesamum alatum]|uniref:Uncharacterized protein n=1 Tax=Sesamum alatum TaxID=300844 RepID=A0AAE1XY66_9LAMI|nr:hypothetical protein Salat_2422600 [Sesamum alatum]
MASRIRMDLAMATGDVPFSYKPSLKGCDFSINAKFALVDPLTANWLNTFQWIYKSPNLVLAHGVHFGFHGLKPFPVSDIASPYVLGSLSKRPVVFRKPYLMGGLDSLVDLRRTGTSVVTMNADCIGAGVSGTGAGCS